MSEEEADELAGRIKQINNKENEVWLSRIVAIDATAVDAATVDWINHERVGEPRGVGFSARRCQGKEAAPCGDVASKF